MRTQLDEDQMADMEDEASREKLLECVRWAMSVFRQQGNEMMARKCEELLK